MNTRFILTDYVEHALA